MNFWDTFYGVLFNPVNTFTSLKSGSYLKSSIVSVIFISLILSLNNLISSGENSYFIYSYSILNILALAFVWFFVSILIYIPVDFAGGSGKITDTLTATGYSFLPLIFLAPAKTFSFLFGDYSSYCYSTFQTLIYVWVGLLTSIAIKQIHRIHISQAILSVFSVLFVFLLMLVGFFTVLIAGAFTASI